MAAIKKISSNADLKSELIKRLEVDLAVFRDICSKIPDENIDPKVREAIREFSLDVIHFINQYRMTDQSISDINKPPGRRINFEEREYFREVVTTHQLVLPNTFPSWKIFSNDLDKFNIEIRKTHGLPELIIESRTYDKWIQWWKNGEFDHVVHD